MDSYFETKFYIIRHGQTQWNVEKLFQGHLDSPLTNEGLEQARLMHKRLLGVHFDAVFASDLLRAKRTAEIIVLERNLNLVTSRLLRERSYGPFEGKKREAYIHECKDLLRQSELLSQKQRWDFKIHPNVETDAELFSRLNVFLREVAVAYAGKTVLVVTHAGSMRTLLRKLDHNLQNAIINNTAYIQLISDGVDFFIEATEGITY